METMQINGKEIVLDDDMALVNPDLWDREVAASVAKGLEVGPLTDKHWQVIDYMRADYQEKEATPTVRRITKNSGVNTKELYELFPGGPGKKAAIIAGIPKPKGCV